MIVCPNCKAKNFDGTLYCRDCGVRLEELAGVTTQSLDTGSGSLIRQNESEQERLSSLSSLGATMTLQVIEGDQFIPLSGKQEFILGRVNRGQKILPDVDFTPHGGYDLGVSRLHAAIVVAGSEIWLKDLGSVNGTRLNKEKLIPHIPQKIQNGDQISLGKLRLRVILYS